MNTTFENFALTLYNKYNSGFITPKETYEDLGDFQQDLLKEIKPILNNDLKELCTFFADDFLIKKIEWKEYLLEMKIFKTKSGGSTFFTRLEKYINDCNYEMCNNYLVALKLGFTGANENTQIIYEKYYKKFKDIFNIQNEIFQIKPYEKDLQFINNYNIHSIMIPLILIFIVPLLQKLYYMIHLFETINQVFSNVGG